MQYHSCVYAFLGMQSPRIVLILVLEWLYSIIAGLMPFGDSYSISDILFEHFYLKIQNRELKKKADPDFQIFWVGRKRANKHVFSF